MDFPIPDGPHLLGSHQRQLVHSPLGPNLLVNADAGVAQHHNEEGHILDGGAADDQKHRQNEKHQIEEGEAVFQNDLLFGLAGTFGRGVAQAIGQSMGCLLPGQALLRGSFNDINFHRIPPAA